MKTGSNSIPKGSSRDEDCPGQYRETNCHPADRYMWDY